MKSARLTALVLGLAISAPLTTLAVVGHHSTTKTHSAAIVAPVVVAPSPVREERASRSRSYVPVKPPVAAPMSAKPHHPPVLKVTISSPRPARTHQAATRRLVVGSHYGGVHDITMYCGGGTTASGKTVREGMVATLDRSIPFGTEVSIEGMGTYVVEDRIGHGSEFDIYTSSCSHAREFGRHRLRVTF